MSLLRLLPLAALVLAACMDDSPLGPAAGQAQLALAVSGNLLPGTTISARIYWVDPAQTQQREPGQVTLATARVAADTGTVRLPLLVDLRPCLPRDRQGAGAWCDVYIELQLAEGEVALLRTIEGPIRLTAGASATAPRVYLAAGNSPPALVMVEAAEPVDQGLFRLRLSGTDPDGDLIGVDAELKDSSGVVGPWTSAALAAPYAAFTGAVYLPKPETLHLAFVKASLRDTRRNTSLQLTTSVAPLMPLLAPHVSEVAGVVGESHVELSFQVTDPQGDAEVVDVVFRNVVDGEIVVADTIYGSCRRSITPGNGRKTVSCPRTPGMRKALVVVVPFDVTGHWGPAGRCALTTSTTAFSCAAP